MSPSRAPLLSALGAALLLLAPPASAHVAQFPLDGKKIEIRADEGNARKNKLVFQAKKQSNLAILHDPTIPLQEMKLLVRASDGTRSELIELPAEFWKPIGKADDPKGWKYKDKAGTAGGVKSVQLKPGSLTVKGGGDNWTWGPEGALEDLELWIGLEEEWFCTSFGGKIQKNGAGYFKAKAASAPATCEDAICGNGLAEATEQCDDGNLDDTDSCTSACERDCSEAELEYESTFEAIQDIVFDGYGCTASVCHGTAQSPAGELSLLPDVAYENLFQAQATAVEGVRVFPADKNQSFLFEKLAAATFPDDFDTTNSPMPVGGALTPDHLEAVELWIEGGAPAEGVVLGTDALLGSCLPEPVPLKIDPPAAPAAGVGVQLRSNGWFLGAESEGEKCYATWYDFSATDLVPEALQVDCPDTFGPNNTSDKCFRVHRKTLAQDPQSHHSIIFVYGGEGTPNEVSEEGRGWGPWTYKFSELDHPQNDQSCDPTAVDPETGVNDGCTGEIFAAVGCLGELGPPDFEPSGFGFFDEGASTREFHISQEAYFDQEFADGVYLLLPMTGTLVWNSHAFNLTSFDTRMAQYLNLEFAQPGDDLYETQRIFAAEEIFTQNVQAFGTAEYCHTWTAPLGARITRLSSHTHRFGLNWRTWAPPNEPCTPDGDFGGLLGGGGPETCALPANDDQLIYVNNEYSDPVQLYPDPPMALDSPNAADRTFKYCAQFDNGSTPDSPAVKQQSTSPAPTPISVQLNPSQAPFEIFLGGPCSDLQVRCMDGPNKGERCASEPVDFCDTAAGAGDGMCDACPVTGGTTTEDEMFILLGDYYVP
jgi:cysteine-rich repeat protein